MRTILHDWSDEESSQILSTLRAAIGATPVTLTIVEVCSSPAEHAEPGCLAGVKSILWMCRAAPSLYKCSEGGRGAQTSMLNEWADPFPVREFLDLHMMVRCVAVLPQQFGASAGHAMASTWFVA